MDELRVSIAALGEPGGVFEMLLPSAVAPRPTAVRADDSRREGAHSGEEDYRPPLKQASCARSGSGSDSGSGSGSGSGEHLHSTRHNFCWETVRLVVSKVLVYP